MIVILIGTVVFVVVGFGKKYSLQVHVDDSCYLGRDSGISYL